MTVAAEKPAQQQPTGLTALPGACMSWDRREGKEGGKGRKDSYNEVVTELTLPPPVTVPKKSSMHSQGCSFSLDKNS